jgi:hypothetical protein
VVTVTLDAVGGVVTSPDARARLEFPPGALSGPAAIVASALRPERDSRGGVRLARFRLNAYALDEQGRVVEPLTRFARAYTLTVDVRGILDVPALQPNERLALYFMPDPSTSLRADVAEQAPSPGEWIEIAQTQQPQPGVLEARLDHFTDFGAAATASPSSGWKLLYNPPVPDLFSGAATYNYPIDMPPGRNGLQPKVNLAYNSRGLDGLVGYGAIDSGPIGMGWSLNFIDIIRDDTRVLSDGAMSFPNRFSLLIDGTAYELQPATANATYGRYHVKDAPGLFVERHNDQWSAGSPSNASHEYWIVRLPDGALARLGYTTNSEQTTTGFVLCDAYCGQTPVSRWRVDVMTDTLGNVMAFTYIEQAINQTTFTSEQSRPTQIQYNSIAGGYGSRVEFTHSSEPNGQAIDRIYVFNAGLKIREYRLVQAWLWELDSCNQSIGTYALNSIQMFNGAGGASLPATTFTHTALAHRNNGCGKFNYISRVANGYGGATEFSYLTDGRQAGCYPAIGCEGIGHSYRVSEMRTYDGLTPSPAKEQFAYGTRCYHQSSASDTNGGALCRGAGFIPYWGPLVGHDVVTRTVLDFNGTTALSRDVRRYYITDTSPLRGREYQSQVYNPAGSQLLSQVSNAYTTVNVGQTTFTYLRQADSSTYDGGVTASQRISSTYETTYGNLTHRFEMGDATASGDERTIQYGYNPLNTAASVGPWPRTQFAVSSTGGGPAGNLIDNNTGTWWDSQTHQGQGDLHTEWLAVWFDGFHTVDFVKLYPYVYDRLLPNGTTVPTVGNFPADFKVYYSNGSQWVEILSFTNYPNPYAGQYVVLRLP